MRGSIVPKWNENFKTLMKTTALVTVELLSFCPLSSLTKGYYYNNNMVFT